MYSLPPTQESPLPHESAGATAVVWRSHQLQLLEWFASEAPSLAAPYKAAVTLITYHNFPARVHLICHIVRDIYNKLPEALDGTHRRRDANFFEMIDEVEKHWVQYTRESFTEPTDSGVASESTLQVSVSMIAVRKVGELLEKHRAHKKQPKSAEVLAQALYQRFVEDGVTPSQRLINTFEKERKWFTKRAHLVRDSDKIPTDDGLQEHFETFERILHTLVAPHFLVQRELDDILQQANQ